MMSTNEYSDYNAQMYDFFWKYDQDVGYETLKNKNLTHEQKNALTYHSNINDFNLTVDKIYKKWVMLNNQNHLYHAKILYY